MSFAYDDGPDYIISGNFYYTLSEDNTLSLDSYSGTSSRTLPITIPSAVQGHTVTEIGYNVFEGFSNVATVTLPDTLLQIDDSAFANCTSLTTINIPDSLEYVGQNAFYNTPWLDAQTANPLYIGRALYDVNYNSNNIIKNLVVKDGTVSISECAIGNSYSDEESYETIYEKDEWIESITLPSSIKEAYLSHTAKVKSVNLPQGITFVDLSDSASLESCVLPDTIDGFYFTDCPELTSVKILDNAEKIQYCAFSGCTKLSNVNIPAKATFIDDDAFYGTAIKSAKLPENMEYLGSYAFADCENLTDVTLPKIAECVCGRVFHNSAWYNAQPDGAIYIADKLNEVKNESGKSFTLNIKEGTTEVCDEAAMQCSSLVAVTFPKSLLNIGWNAFSYTGLQSVDISSTLENLSSNAFSYCNKLTAVKINCETIGADAFISCTNLKSVEIGSNVKYIMYNAFYGCTNLRSVIIPDNVETIDWDAFGVYEKAVENEEDWQLLCINNFTIYSDNPAAKEYANTQLEDSDFKINVVPLDTVEIAGDINYDGICTTKDLLVLRKALAGQPAYVNNIAGDCNKDGTVNTKDVLLMRKYLAKIVAEF